MKQNREAQSPDVFKLHSSYYGTIHTQWLSGSLQQKRACLPVFILISISYRQANCTMVSVQKVHASIMATVNVMQDTREHAQNKGVTTKPYEFREKGSHDDMAGTTISGPLFSVVQVFAVITLSSGSSPSTYLLNPTLP